jgi:hypothetical protein
MTLEVIVEKNYKKSFPEPRKNSWYREMDYKAVIEAQDKALSVLVSGYAETPNASKTLSKFFQINPIFIQQVSASFDGGKVRNLICSIQLIFGSFSVWRSYPRRPQARSSGFAGNIPKDFFNLCTRYSSQIM